MLHINGSRLYYNSHVSILDTQYSVYLPRQ